jgi:uncharacterized protein YbcI
MAVGAEAALKIPDAGERGEARDRSVLMKKHRPTLVQEIAQAVIAFQQQTTSRTSKLVTVVLSQDTLVVMLHEALSPAEKDLAKRPSGAAQVQEFHRQLFTSSSRRLQEEIRRITGVEWPQAVAEVEPTTGDIVQVFTRSAEVQVFRLAQSVPGDTWSGRTPGEPLSEGS